MSFLEGLNGTAAALLICSLLFVDEAGLPLPIAPSEALLLLTGVLIASDAFPLWIIVPADYLAMAIGMMTGYGWARTVGQSGLQAIAERVHATEAYDRAQARLKSASWWGIAVARMVPGLRPYVTLASGAAEIDIRTVALGAFPALLLWEIIWVLVGMLVGLPVAHFLGRFEKLALRGAILVVLGIVIWFAVRDSSADRRGGLARITPRLRASLALAVDAGVVLSIVGGLFAIGRRVTRVSTNGWIEPLVAALLLIVLLIIARRRPTPGETLFDTHYWQHLRVTLP
jgi:membrane protein DedA with SNARE-associated domain